MDTSPIGDPVGLISGINLVYLPCSERLADLLCSCIEAQGVHYVRGTVASGDVFVASPEQRARITRNFDAVACEMEGAAICQVCYANGVEVGILRAISDNCNDPSTMDYQTFRDSSAKVGCKILLDFMTRI
jgi:adenosylhomocysteine nucleosidase